MHNPTYPHSPGEGGWDIEEVGIFYELGTGPRIAVLNGYISALSQSQTFPAVYGSALSVAMASSFEEARRMMVEPAKGMGVSEGRVGRSSMIPP